MPTDRNRLGNWPWCGPLTPANVVAAHRLVDAVQTRKLKREESAKKMCVALRRIEVLLAGGPCDEELAEAQLLARAAVDEADEAGW